jgi:hypothetical protein
LEDEMYYMALHTVKDEKPFVVEAHKWGSTKNPPKFGKSKNICPADRTCDFQTSDGWIQLRAGDWTLKLLQDHVKTGRVVTEAGRVQFCPSEAFQRTYRPCEPPKRATMKEAVKKVMEVESAVQKPSPKKKAERDGSPGRGQPKRGERDEPKKPREKAPKKEEVKEKKVTRGQKEKGQKRR